MSLSSLLITGANGGIGKAFCDEFTNAGWRVVATDNNSQPVAKVDEFCQIDLNKFCIDTSYRSEKLSDLRGLLPDGLSCLINNAAVQLTDDIEDLTIENWVETLNVNTLAPFLMTQGLLKTLEIANGNVINIASIHSQLTKPGFCSYATSKAALVGLTRSMAVELGNRVRVNAISPAAILTPMLESGFAEQPSALTKLASFHPVERLGDPVEVAKLAVWVAGESSTFFNGVVLDLSGAISSRLHDPS